MAHSIRPYNRSPYPVIEGNERSYMDNEFRKIEECLKSVINSILGTRIDLTIASGVITIPTNTHVLIIFNMRGEGGAADDLVTITGGNDGQIAVLKTDGAATLTVKDSTGNIRLAGDMILDHIDDTVTVYYHNSTWREIARSNNA